MVYYKTQSKYNKLQGILILALILASLKSSGRAVEVYLYPGPGTSAEHVPHL